MTADSIIFKAALVLPIMQMSLYCQNSYHRISVCSLFSIDERIIQSNWAGLYGRRHGP